MVYPNDCYILKNNNEVLIHATAWMSFENIMLSASNQTQKAMDFMIHLYKVYRIDKSIEAEYRLVVDCWGQGKERMGGQSLLSRRLSGEKQE